MCRTCRTALHDVNIYAKCSRYDDADVAIQLRWYTGGLRRAQHKTGHMYPFTSLHRSTTGKLWKASRHCINPFAQRAGLPSFSTKAVRAPATAVSHRFIHLFNVRVEPDLIDMAAMGHPAVQACAVACFSYDPALQALCCGPNW